MNTGAPTVELKDSVSKSWLEQAEQLPLAFSMVREDALIDLAIARSKASPPHVFMIASGGCTLATLAAANCVSSIHAVDINPAQLNLCRLKLRLLQFSAPHLRKSMLGHSYMSSDERKEALFEHFAELNLPSNCFGNIDLVARRGPDQAGRYEHLFEQLRAHLSPYHERLMELLTLDDIAQQQQFLRLHKDLIGNLRAAFESVMADDDLARLFGEAALRNRTIPFAEHFFEQTLNNLNTLPARSNPYLWQVLAGCFPTGSSIPWLMMNQTESIPEVSFEQNNALDALRHSKNRFDMIHLSNVLDWFNENDARELLEIAHQKLNDSGTIVIRQLNSTLKIRELGNKFIWDEQLSQQYLEADRSYFYKQLHIGTQKANRGVSS